MGPLEGIRIVEFAGIGPGPFAGMMLADMGAEILRIDRQRDSRLGDPRKDISVRGRRSIALDLKHPDGAAAALRVIDRADGLIEGFRPGVMERLGIGPRDCHDRNPKLVYGRMTGWGQSGELSHAAGHDLNYIAITGALWAMGEADRQPMPPLNLLGDFGGGGMFLAFGMVCALLKARQTGVGDVVDAAISDGVTSLMAPVYANVAKGLWKNARQSNRLDGAAPFYRTYACKDDGWITIAAIEPQFFALLLDKLGLSDADVGDRLDQTQWPEQRALFADIFRRKTRDEWTELFEGTDICYAPVLDLEEAPAYGHNRSRSVFVEAHGIRQPAPAPRFANSAPELPGPPPAPGEHNDTALLDWGFSDREIERLKQSGALVAGQSNQ